MNKSGNSLIGLCIMFFGIAVALSWVIWGDVSWAAKIGLFACGFASGALAGQWIVKRMA
ncbi:MAG TPA: hypothetical protein VK897_01640 [Anaerolineales bacterium]|nr:hypothetical protein [Anaerolineales bacterium]